MKLYGLPYSITSVCCMSNTPLESFTDPIYAVPLAVAVHDLDFWAPFAEHIFALDLISHSTKFIFLTR